MDIRVEIGLAIAGLAISIFAKSIAKYTVDFQRESWGINFSKNTLHILVWIYRIVGVLMIINSALQITSN